MIYTDGIHMVSDISLKELHQFAEIIGIKRCWFHGSCKGHPHYDLMEEMKERALENGAIKTTSKKIVQILNNYKKINGN